MRRILAGLALTVALLAGGAGPAHASHRDRCYERDCGGDDWGGGSDGNSGGDYGHGKNGDQGDAGRDQCHSFCNNVIIIPDPTKKGGDQQPASLTDPRKLPTVIAQIAKSGLDMGQLFATTTIKFVEDLFTALA